MLAPLKMVSIVRKSLDWLGAHGGFTMLLVLLIVVGGTWGFIMLADEVIEGDTQHFDERAILALRDPSNPAKLRGPSWLAEAGRDITGLGGVLVLALVTAAVIGYLLIEEKFYSAVFVLCATSGGLLLSTALKWLIDRPRPSVVPHSAYVYTTSFPSGHSMMSATVYLTLGSLLMRFAPNRRLKIYYLAIAIMLTFLVGVSRVYMGVHYPTDVLAGWTAGLVWALICWLVARALQIHGAVEKDTEGVLKKSP